MCGIIGIYSFNKQTNVFPRLVKGLMDLQNRGQLSAGITTYDPERKRILQTYKENGKVDEVFRINHKYKLKSLTSSYSGNIGIGHTRYATSGDDSDTLAQPFERPHGRLSKWFSIAYNGNLSNYSQLKTELEQVGYNMTYDSDTEIIMHYLSRDMQKNSPQDQIDFTKLLQGLSNEFDGAWNLCFVNAEGKFFACRDPNGFHPLCYGVGEDFVIVASESSVINNLHLKAYDMSPGTVLTIEPNKNTFNIVNFARAKKSFCFFEYIYFANTSSIFDNVSVYETREKIGEQLAVEETAIVPDADTIVVPVPDTSYVAASQYAAKLNLPFVAGILKNHQVGRTFITGHDRIEKIRMKFSFIREKLKNKKVILIDDSIVRGTTLKGLVKVLKDWCKVKEVHVRIGCPPLVSPCFYGIDFPTLTELYAGKNLPNHEDFDAESLKYITLAGLYNSISASSSDLCTSCITTNYPTTNGKLRYKEVLNAQ